MKTLIQFLMIALGVAAILYCRVNLGVSWGEMNTALENLLPRLLSIGIVLLGLVVTLAYMNRSRRPD